jgi:putative colanic acid biosynthesis acetyltransferase WcaF
MNPPQNSPSQNKPYLYEEPQSKALAELLEKMTRGRPDKVQLNSKKLTSTKVRNDLFDADRGLVRGRTRTVEAMWYLLKCLLFLTPIPIPSAIKRTVLRWFGACIGRGVVIKPRVNIHFPWKLTLGDHAWVGEEVFILNFEPVNIGAHCCISQRAFLCTGNHDYRQPDMRYRNRAITVEDGAWIGAQVFVSPDVTIGTEAVITAGSVVTKNQPAKMVCGGNPCVAVKHRWPDNYSGGFRFDEYQDASSGKVLASMVKSAVNVQ